MGAILKELHNSASKFQFPSMPNENVDVKRETSYQEYNILGKGKMSYPSGMGTQIIKWSGYFWGAGRKKLASVNQKWIAPKTCASKLKNWQTIGKRVGHSAEKITYRYAHLFPSVQLDMAEQLDAENMKEEPNEMEGGFANVS